MPRALYIFCILFLFALGAVVVAVNAEFTRVELLFGTAELTTGQWLVLVFFLGWIAGVISAWHFVRRLTQERGELRRKLRLAEAELKNVRPVVSRDGV
jgi:uncharacterized membrane protein